MPVQIVSKNPATGEVLASLDATPIETLPALFERARQAQVAWALIGPRRRADFLFQLRETLIHRLDDCADLITREAGKPKMESLINDLFPSVELLTHFANRGPRLLADKRIHLRLLRHRKSILNYWPLGVVVVISPWNYPFMLPFGDIVMALMAGNAVVFKPSEVTPLVGLKIQELCDEAGIPPGIIQTVIGEGALGAALIQNKPDKVFFTGSVITGKRVMAAAAEHLIPVNLELGGKDPMIILADADLDFATSAALWGGFSNSGQACASVERILVQESIAEKFTALLKQKVESLRQGNPGPGNVDLGAICYEKQKATYDTQLKQARDENANFVTGGAFSDDRRYLAPTVITGSGAGETIESLDVYREETFGPVVAVTTFKTPADAIRKANDSRYGLMSSVITRSHAQGDRIARQLHAGGVTINEVMYTAGIAETPWGGLKETGFGRTHSDEGLYEFVNVRHIHSPRSRFFVFKALWWFPYGPYQYALFRNFVELYRRSWFDKLRAIPLVLWSAVQFFKREKRV